MIGFRSGNPLLFTLRSWPTMICTTWASWTGSCPYFWSTSWSWATRAWTSWSSITMFDFRSAATRTMDITTMDYGWPMEISTTPMTVRMISIPTLIFPGAIMTPISPMPMEITVVYPMISRWHNEDIVRWYNHDIPRDESFSNRYPGSAVKGSLEPMTSVEAIPEASVEIKASHIWHQVDIAWSTGNYHHIRWS